MKATNNNIFAYLRNSKSLCWLDDCTLLFYKRGCFYKYNSISNTCFKISKMPIPHKISFLSKFKLFRRMLRLYPMSGVIDKLTNEFVFTFYGAFYSLELSTGKIVKEISLSNGSKRVLSICACNNGEIFYGEYPTSSNVKNVSIIKRSLEKKHSIVYTFGNYEIRHIHLLFEHNDDIFCFTGDEDNEVKTIVFKNKNFESKPIFLVGDEQKYRTCVASLREEKLFYLTDTPYFHNYIYCLDLKSQYLKQIQKIEGTVIYGLQSKNGLYFSTVVENNLTKKKNGENQKIKIDGKHGGILSKKAIIYYLNFQDLSLTRIFELKKDAMPFKLCGLGTFIFPCNDSEKYLAFSSSSLKRDETTFIYDKKSL